jgi:hypothetical protein
VNVREKFAVIVETAREHSIHPCPMECGKDTACDFCRGRGEVGGGLTETAVVSAVLGFVGGVLISEPEPKVVRTLGRLIQNYFEAATREYIAEAGEDAYTRLTQDRYLYGDVIADDEQTRQHLRKIADTQVERFTSERDVTIFDFVGGSGDTSEDPESRDGA